MAKKKRFDKWPPLIPKVGQVIQVQVGDDKPQETTVISRHPVDERTFRIWVNWSGALEGRLGLEITPSASGRGMVDRAEDRKPWWRTVPTSSLMDKKPVSVFLLDEPDRLGLEPGIDHNIYHNGRVQSLGWTHDKDTKMSVGVVLPGSHNFGTAECKERIRVHSGSLTINGEKYSYSSGSCVINPGDQVQIDAEEPSYYLCIYGD